MNSFTIPCNMIRKGDWLLTNYYVGEESDGLYRQVVESHQYLGWEDPNNKNPVWVVQMARTQDEWDWARYPKYGMQPNDEYDGPAEIWPRDCLIEQCFYDFEALVEIDSEKIELLNPNDLLPYRWYVGVFEVDRVYGGPEEGGWWFTTGEVKQVVPCATQEMAYSTRDELVKLWESTGDSGSVLYRGGDYQVSVCKNYPEDFPKHRPHYS